MNVTVGMKFITDHWLLCSATLMVLILLIYEEFRGDNSKGISCEQLVALINHKKIRLLDLRSPELFKLGHIRGSMNVTTINEQQKDEAKDVDAIILINQKGNVPTRLLRQYPNKGYFLTGGIDAWLQTNLPLEK